MNAFRQFVEANVRWFRGHLPETDASLDAAEQTLDVPLPPDIRWLLRDYGYWHATGISSLDETITDTLAAREHLDLPPRYIVLFNHDDGGLILLDTIANPDTGQHTVYNAGIESIPDELENDIVYHSLLEYVQTEMSVRRPFVTEEDLDYDPSRYHTP